jgi:hypothetical protein
VSPASAENSNEVLPEEGGPKISVSAPHGNPPASASTEAIPVETVGGATRSRSSEAGTRANLSKLLRIALSRSVEYSALEETGIYKDMDDMGTPQGTESGREERDQKQPVGGGTLGRSDIRFLFA